MIHVFPHAITEDTRAQRDVAMITSSQLAPNKAAVVVDDSAPA